VPIIGGVMGLGERPHKHCRKILTAGCHQGFEKQLKILATHVPLKGT
jgi:hypothetical protein